MPEPYENPLAGVVTITHHDVFISYAQHDKPVADAICAKLEARKIRCWISPRDLPPAKDFPEAIIEAIEGAQVIVLVFSSYANTSPHVTRELTNAVNKARIIIPFRVEDVTPSKSMEYLIGVPHWLDAISPPLDNHIDQLADTVENLLVRKREIYCHACNTPLPPQAKFCNACGAAVMQQREVATVSPKEQSPPPSAEAGATPLPAPPGEGNEARAPVHDASPEKAPAGPGTTGEAMTPPPGASPPVPQRGSRRSRAVTIGSIALLMILLVAIMAIFPSLMNSREVTAGTTGIPGQTTNTAAASTTVVLTTEPTRGLPKDSDLVIEAEKDMTNAMVTVRFSGGGGMGLVQNNTVILSRSDGTVVTGKLDFSQRSTEVVLPGTRATDRLQVIVTMKSGNTYTVVDRLIPYRYFHET